jgi:hypothetical protein
VAQVETSPEPLRRELQPRKRIDRDRIRVDERTHVAKDEVRFAALEQHAGPVAEG